MQKSFLLFCFCTLFYQVNGQVYFERDIEFNNETPTKSSTVISVVDLNGDYLDDIISIDKEFNLIISYQTPSGIFDKKLLYESLFSNAVYSITFGDYDQNGHLDILVAGESVPLLFYQNEDHSFRRDFLGDTPFVAQSANTIDIDGDGLLDIFVCDDNAESKTFKNEGNTLNPFSFLDMKTKVTSDNSGNYSTVWFDIENDGDLDLYIGKCRSGVSDPNDPRRVNALYINDSGVFKEDASTFNIGIGRQTWSTSTGDLDNDGDEDIIITNHYSQSQILVNQNTHFEVIDLDLKEFFGIQGVVTDINLDGLQDIIIASLSDEILLINKGNLEFEVDYKLLGDFDNGQSFAVGDLNNDLSPDLIAQTADGDFDQIFYNQNINENNSLKISLTSFDDVHAIGAFIKLYGPWGIQSQRVVSGESYGITNSLSRLFGFGKFEFADSMIISWPDGTRLKEENVLHNQHLLIQQNGCIEKVVSLDKSTYGICDNMQNIELPNNYTEYLWSDGEMGQERILGAGIYSVKMKRSDGCFDILSPIQIKPYQKAEGTLIQASNTTICNEVPVSLSSNFLGQYTWSTGDTSAQSIVTNPGVYYLELIDQCGGIALDSIIIDESEINSPIPKTDSILKGESYIIELEEGQFLRSIEGDSLLSIGGNYETGSLDTTTSYALSNVGIDVTKQENIGLVIPSQSFSAAAINSGIVFDVHQRLILNSVEVYTEIAGERQLTITDSNNKMIHFKEIDIDTGYQVLELDFFLETGTNYTLSTDVETNISSIGSQGPQFGRSAGSGEPFFPFELEDRITLTKTLHGRSNYYYYYNWNISVPLSFCESEPALINIIVKNPVNTSESLFSNVSVYPNPTSDYIYLDGLPNKQTRVTLFSMDGKQILTSSGIESYINIRSLKSGMYWLQLTEKDNSVVKKIIKL